MHFKTSLARLEMVHQTIIIVLSTRNFLARMIIIEIEWLTLSHDMKENHYYWPHEEERKVISHEIYQKYGFPNYLGFIDGTLFPLFFKRIRADCSDYCGRKLVHTLSFLLIYDHNLCIRYFNVRWPGSTYDDRMWRNSEVLKNKDKCFCVYWKLISWFCAHE